MTGEEVTDIWCGLLGCVKIRFSNTTHAASDGVMLADFWILHTPIRLVLFGYPLAGDAV